MLNTLQIFDGVKTTRDYSIVTDRSKSGWYTTLTANHTIVFSKDVNYYRLFDTVRIEAKYETIRKCPYGCLILRDADGNDYDRFYFWIDDVKLLKQNSQTVRDTYDVIQSQNDVLELSISEDVWANNYGNFTLYDSYVERKHMPRWKNTGTELSPVWEPIYYPNAGQGVEGAYEKETTEDMTPPVTFTGYNDTFDLRFIVVFALDSNGEAKVYIGMDVATRSNFVPVYQDFANGYKYFGVQQLLDGTFYTATGLTANMVQSITVVPYLGGLRECLRLGFAGGDFYLYFDETSPLFSNWSSAHGGTGDGKQAWLTLNFGMQRLFAMMQYIYSNPTVIEPDHSAQPVDGEYLDEHEPMMYMSPARVRKVVTAFGGEVFTLPDIAAFKGTFCLQNIFDMNTAITYVFAGSDIQEANAIGAIGVLEAATLPIYNSAWRSYEAINKVGDEIAYNAKQMQTFANGAAGTASNAIVGGAIGGGLGAAANIITGIVGTGTAMYGNEEELRAKQTVIKNSPCDVKSGGSGLGAYVRGLTDVFYLTLKMDDQSMEKLRQMYYWYGYHVNRMIKGSISLHTRSKFDYIKTNGAKIRGMIPSSASKQLSEIFDRGVSVFHAYDSIGTSTLYENDEV